MSLKMRLFGKKLISEELTNLMDVLNIEKSVLNNQDSKWTTSKYWGKCLITPNGKGLNIDLHIFRKDFHIFEGEDFRREREIHGEVILNDLRQTGDIKYSTSKIIIKKKIPYNKINLK